MTVIKEVLSVWHKIGVLDVILPFALIFAIVYGTLDRTKIIGDENQQYNKVIAFVLGFIGVAALQQANYLQPIVAWSAVALIGVVFLAVIGKFMGGIEFGKKQNFPKYIALILMALIAVYSLGFLDWINISFIESSVLPFLLSLGGVFLVLLWILGPMSKESKPTDEKGKVQLKHKKRIKEPKGRGKPSELGSSE